MQHPQAPARHVHVSCWWAGSPGSALASPGLHGLASAPPAHCRRTCIQRYSPGSISMRKLTLWPWGSAFLYMQLKPAYHPSQCLEGTLPITQLGRVGVHSPVRGRHPLNHHTSHVKLERSNAATADAAHFSILGPKRAGRQLGRVALLEEAIRMLACECRLSPMLALAKSRTRLLSADLSGLASLRTMMYVQPTAQ